MKYSKIFRDFNPEIKVSSPGRINLIGEHTDYNNGFVMPTAIDKMIFFELKKNDSKNICRIYSETYDSYFEFHLDEIYKQEAVWKNYLLGVVDEIYKAGKKLSGFDCIVKSELPIGAGISSSAALECGFATGLNELFTLNFSKLEIVKLCQLAENNFVRSNCGIMDQFASVMSKKDHIILLDCRNLEAEFIPADFEDCQILLLNSNVAHSLADSEYNTRRKECELAVELIQKWHPEINSLREVDFSTLEEYKNQLSENTYRRSHYVIKENERVQQASKSIKKGNLKEFGRLMYQSHRGLQYNYEVSCPELDFMVDYSEEKDFIYGSRMMGGGFGGCTINLIEREKIDSYVKEIREAYFKEFNIKMDAILVSPGSGTTIHKYLYNK